MESQDDVSQCLEPSPICCEEGVPETLTNFKYVKCNVLGPGTPETQFEDEFEGCHCSNCDNNCPCVQRFGPTYRPDGKLIENVVFCPQTKPIYECNRNCKCDHECVNRVVQLGVRTKLCVFRTSDKGLGLRTSEAIAPLKFVCEYAGEILTEKEAKKRAAEIDKKKSMNYIFALREFVANDSACVTWVDPEFVGNVGRFINHSCGPNLFMLPVRVDNNVPKLCLFSAREIKGGEELTFDYSGEFRIGEDSKGGAPPPPPPPGRKPCLCGAETCRGFLPYDSTLL